MRALYALGVADGRRPHGPGLGRDVGTVAEVAAAVPVQLVAATGCYARASLPLLLRSSAGPGRPLDGPDPLVELFLRDIEEGIAGTAVRAGMIKVVTDAAASPPTSHGSWRRPP